MGKKYETTSITYKQLAESECIMKEGGGDKSERRCVVDIRTVACILPTHFP